MINANRVNSYSEATKPGDFYWRGSRCQFICPCGCGALGGVETAGQYAWDWDGNLNHPTFNPSIRFLSGCQWHGYLRNGLFKSCGEE